MASTPRPRDVRPADPPPEPAHSAPEPARRIVAFDGLRGACALMVLSHHLMLTQPTFANYEWGVPRTHAWGPIGWLLVATPLRLLWSGQERALLFFVLSGFVLSLPWLDRHPAPYGRFLLGRFCRIYPPYLCAMALAAVGSTLLGGHPLPDASIYVRSLGWVFEPTAAAIPSIAAVLGNPASSYMNEAMWSLVWEVRVAIIFPLLMFPIVHWGNKALLLLVVGLVLLARMTGALIGPDTRLVLNSPQETFHFAEMFLFGVAVALNRQRLSTMWSKSSATPGVVLLVAGSLICWAPWPFARDQLIGIGAAIILASILVSPALQHLLAARPMLWLGRQSYSLYLIHVPLIMAVVTLGAGVVSVPVMLVLVPACILSAEAFRRFIEKPSVSLAQRLTGYARSRNRRTDLRAQL